VADEGAGWLVDFREQVRRWDPQSMGLTHLANNPQAMKVLAGQSMD
jgi:hypothetical protein